MSRVAVVFWSGTGNTEAMAELIGQGVQEAGGSFDLLAPSEFSVDKLDDYNAIALGCPSMGDEELEEEEFEPMYRNILPKLSGKRMVLFGSYGWGDGEWMRNWEEEVRELGADMVAEGFIVNEAPEGADADACIALGKKLAAN